MLFNSFDFVYFILIFFPIYCLVGQKLKLVILLLASYYFYMCWNINYVVLIFLTTLTSYLASIGIENSNSKSTKKIFLWSSISASLIILSYFKYYNFFVVSINDTAGTNFSLMTYLLPVGISFYTFETFSYTIDVYNKKLNAERNFWIYALFVAFFPKLVAGPIERSENLIPQFYKKKTINFKNITIGVKFIIMGFFMKLVIADRLSIYVDSVYNNVNLHSGGTFILATLSFSFQILCDFAGYSTIAIGIAKCLDYDLMLNFRRPYLALYFSDFWKRWHISLSSWFRDYIYIPLGGNRASNFKVYRNLFLTFLISGLWHGANWTFVAWGALHGIFLIIESIFINKEKKSFLNQSFILRFFKRVFIFLLVSFAWIFFRANSINDALTIINSLFNYNQPIYMDSKTLFFGIIGVAILLLLDTIAERFNKNNFLNNDKLSFPSLFTFAFLVIMIAYFGVFDGGQFIYFQF